MSSCRRLLYALSALILTATGVVACSSGGSASKSGQSKAACLWTSPQHLAKWCPKSGSKLKIAVVIGTTAQAFYITLGNGARDAGKALGADVNVQGSQDFSVVGQTPILNAIIQSKPDALAVALTDNAALDPELVRAAKAGIMVFTVDNDTANAKLRIANLATGQEASGAGAATVMSNAIGGQGKVAMLASSPGPAAVKLRFGGFEQGAKAYPNMERLSVQYCQNQPSVCANDAVAAIARNPGLKGILASGETIGIGAASGVASAHESVQVAVGTWDASPNEVAALKAGKLDFLIAQRPYEEGYQIVSIMQQYLKGAKTITSTFLKSPVARDSLPSNISAPYAVLVRDTALCTGLQDIPCGSSSDASMQKYFYTGS